MAGVFPVIILCMEIVIIGNGIAAQRAVMEIYKRQEGVGVTVVADGKLGPYPRPRLPEYIKGSVKRTFFETDAFSSYAAKGLRRIDSKCISVERKDKLVLLEDGKKVPYDKLILATGSKANRLSLPGGDAEGIFTLRSLEDADRIISYIGSGISHPLVIGAGLLGLEAALALRERSGRDVLVVETAGYLLPRQFDEASSLYLERLLNGKGLYFSKGAAPVSFSSDSGRVSSVLLKDGRTLEADMVVEAVGVSPDKNLASACGLECARGIIVDSSSRTGDPDIYAVGDAAEFDGLCPGLVYFANESARVAASNATGGEERMSLAAPGAYISCAGIDAYSLGDFSAGNKRVEFESDGRMEAVFLSPDGVLKGVVAVGSRANMTTYQKALGHPFDRSVANWA